MQNLSGVYAYSALAESCGPDGQSRRECRHVVGVVQAASPTEARAKVGARLLRTSPPGQGWKHHQIVVTAVAEALRDEGWGEMSGVVTSDRD